MSFEEDRRNNGRANNLTVRYIDTRPRERDLERERYERCRLERDDRQKRYYEDLDRDRGRDHRDIQDCKLNHYENTKWSREANDGTLNNKMVNDQYCLRWNSYETNLLSTFEGLLDSEALSDVTLFCEGESFKAHRLVLAACSAHFSKLFSNSTLNGQLIVILEGTHHQDLQILLQFMYKGVAYLHQDRIESVLRTAEVLQVKGLSDGGVDGLNRSSRDGGRPNSRAWSPPGPPPEGFKKDRDLEPSSLGPRSTSPTPSGRLKAESQLAGSMPPPIFSSHYNREHSLLYQRFPFNRTESGQSTSLKPTSTSSLGFPAGGRKADLPSPGARDPTHYSKFSPLRGEREREDFDVNSGPATATLRNKEFDGSKSPGGDLETERERERSPHSSSQRPSSSDQFEVRPKQMTSDSSTDKGVSPGGQPNSRRYPDVDPDRSGGRHSSDQVKTEQTSSPPGTEPRSRTFSGDFSRESLSRLSQSSAGSRTDSFINQTAQDLRTNDHDRDKNLERFEQLRRMAETRGFGGNNMSTIQAIRDTFLPPGGFTLPVTAPLGIPASDLARIAVTVPDPACNGEATSGTGTKLKCPFCERTYGYETNLRAHIRQRHQGIRVPCPFCHRSFTRNNTVRRHIQREHRHQIKPNAIPAKFGSKQILPDQQFQEHMNMSSEHLNLTSQAGSQP